MNVKLNTAADKDVPIFQGLPLKTQKTIANITDRTKRTISSIEPLYLFGSLLKIFPASTVEHSGLAEIKIIKSRMLIKATR
jgi:hypothetical protein